MDLISSNKKDKYMIPNNSKNKYIITFLSQYNINENITDEFISIDSNIIESLDNIKNKKKYGQDKYINKIIYDIGCQILLLKNSKIGITHFSLSDILVINEEIFLFFNNDRLFDLLENNEGIVNFDNIDFDSLFIPPEFKISKKLKNFYYTTSFYSFAKLLLHLFKIDLKDITYTQLFFFCERCLDENPHKRHLLFI